MDINISYLIGYLAVGIVLAYQLYVMVRVVRAAEYSPGQRTAQTILIWMIPFLGAALCHTVLYTTTDRSRPTDKKYLEDDNMDGFDGRLERHGKSRTRDTLAEPGGADAADGD
jgi:hypothetical protein